MATTNNVNKLYVVWDSTQQKWVTTTVKPSPTVWSDANQRWEPGSLTSPYSQISNDLQTAFTHQTGSYPTYTLTYATREVLAGAGFISLAAYPTTSAPTATSINGLIADLVVLNDDPSWCEVAGVRSEPLCLNRGTNSSADVHAFVGNVIAADPQAHVGGTSNYYGVRYRVYATSGLPALTNVNRVCGMRNSVEQQVSYAYEASGWYSQVHSGTDGMQPSVTTDAMYSARLYMGVGVDNPYTVGAVAVVNTLTFVHCEPAVRANTTVTDMYGIRVLPGYFSGQITNMYGVCLQEPFVSGGTITNYYPIWQESATGTNILRATTRIGGATDYAEFEIDGTLVFYNAATYWHDLEGGGAQLKTQGTGVSFNGTDNTLDFTTSANLSDYGFNNYQINHEWKAGSTIYPHIHWKQKQNNTPNWLIKYRWQRNGQAETTAWSNYKCNTNAFTYVSGTLMQISYGAGITPPANYGISDILEIQIFRDNTNASGVFSGTNNYTVTAGASSVDIHLECDTLGSRTQFTK
jgi:hypothetical protein